MSKKLKIVYLITGLDVGGAEMLLWQFLRNLDKKEFDLVVLSFIPTGNIGSLIEKEGIRVESLGIEKYLNEKNGKNIFSIFLRVLYVFFVETPRLYFFIKTEKPDILHSHLFHANLLGRLVGHLAGVPVVVSTIHNVDFGGRLRELALSYTNFLSDATIAISKNVSNKMIEKKVVPKDNLFVIQNGIDTDLSNIEYHKTRIKIREELNINNKKKVLISVGRLVKQKGYPILIDALKKLSLERDDFVSIILGGGEDRESLEKMVIEVGLEKKVLFLGNKQNVREYLVASDIFVMPSLFEGLPLSLLEAMSCGLPVVATSVGGVPEVITDSSLGLLVEENNPEDLLGKIKYLLSLPKEDLEEMGIVGRKRIQENFSINHMVSQYLSLYRRLIN